MHKVKFLFPIALVTMLLLSSGRPGNKEKLEWLSLDEAGQKLNTNKKPVLIDLYTDWCG